MSRTQKPAKPKSREAKTAGRAGTSDTKGPDGMAENPQPRTNLSPGAMTGEDLNDLNQNLAVIRRRAAEFDALWSVASKNGDYVAATAAGLAAAACCAAIQEIYAVWFRMRPFFLTIEGLDRPLASTAAFGDLPEEETSAQALDRLVAEIRAHDADTLAPLEALLPRTVDRNLEERLERIRECPEWSNREGILRDHPPSGCVELFRTLLVAPPVYMDIRGDLAKIGKFRRQAVTFRKQVEALEAALLASSDKTEGRAVEQLTLPGLSLEESEQFRERLDTICAGDVKTRHGREDAERAETVRTIADHFRRYRELSRSEARALFKLEPWSTGIAALARVALNATVTTEDVRGALKNWASD